MINDNLFVITGGPGARKTTVLRELERRGYRCSEEVARQIIQEQVKIGGEALPWANTAPYAELMLTESIAAFRNNSPSSEIIFMGRGVPDVACYLRPIGMPIFFDELMAACESYRYNTKVFMAPPWKEIYTTDTGRKQSWEEAVETHRQMVAVYKELEYKPLEIPRLPPAKRAEFILSSLL